MVSTIIRAAVYEGDRQLRRTAFRFGEEFRLLRRRAGVSQAAVTRGIGVDRSAICRLEAGDPTVSPAIRARAAAVLGADFRLGLYPAASPLIHDAAHARLVESLLQMRHPSWKPLVEARIPGQGRRSSDLRLDRDVDIVLLEFETHVHVLEAIIREGHDKRDTVAAASGPGASVHAVLVLPPIKHHRDLVAAHPDTVRTAFPVPSRIIRRALQEPGGRWPGDGILWLGTGR